ncbi:1007_t:CDS:2 [Entrophospora sp. SA101]|nr:1007_t:CDS:2 [Entrophospora sp. SA101]CAJ0921654.1 6896_t:CDS:2 [Entrophospora sp. SA101]CAJ0921660.1 6898_t:CDS:2 [Entrophospora sp. SA101]CAJ0921705.1 6918_t:CDS:2 [Entrophospora sp. SA101]
MKNLSKLLSSMIIILALLIFSFAICQTSSVIVNSPTSGSKVMNNVFIVQHTGTGNESLAILLSQIDEKGIQYTIRQKLNILQAVSIKLNNASDINTISDLPNVNAVWRVNKYNIRSFFSDDVTGASYAKNRLGLTGNGIKVGIIDGGIDYKHPAFGGCFKTAGCRIQFGKDLIGSGNSEDPVADDDPFEPCDGHGTYISGIIGANDSTTHFTGVAPKAILGVYRVTDCFGDTGDDLIIKAMELAENDGMDIINMSLGVSFDGWPENPSAVAASNLVKKGFYVITAAPNDGFSGLFSSGSPDSGKDVITVGSVNNFKFITNYLVPSTQPKKKIAYFTRRVGLKFDLDGPLEIVPTSDAKDPVDDACNPIAKNLTGKLALIRRGGCFFDDKITNAQTAGALGAIFYFNVTGPFKPAISSSSVPIAIISKNDGEYLIKQFQHSKKIRRNQYYYNHNRRLRVTFPNKTAVFNDIEGNNPVDTSSWGPTFELDIKPEIMAPGGKIFSTLPVEFGSYGTFSGTSAAAAYTSGLVALYLENFRKNPHNKINIDPLILKNILIYTAEPYKSSNDGNHKNKIVLPVTKQGGGLINLERALNTKLYITPGKLSLNDTVRFTGTATISLTNFSHKTMKITLDHLPAGSVRGFFNDTIVNTGDMLINKFYAKVTFHKNTIKLRPRETKSIQIRIKEPSQLLPSEFGLYSGFIIVNDECNHETYSVPYQGLKGNLTTMNLISSNPTSPFLLSPDFDELYNETDEATYTFQDDYDHIPKVYFRSNLGTSRWVLYAAVANENILETVFIDTYTSRTSNNENNEYTNRFTELKWDGTVAVNNQNNVRRKLPNGRYQLILEELRPFGDVNNPNQYDRWRSPIIVINRDI